MGAVAVGQGVGSVAVGQLVGAVAVGHAVGRALLGRLVFVVVRARVGRDVRIGRGVGSTVGTRVG